jgi:ectoine hydroxylase-related dioxygenase (phytanoyl-CoA dioxygenase family)
MYFSDVLSEYGGTAVAEGSHITAMQELIKKGVRGSHNRELVQLIHFSEVIHDVIELTGRAGDVIILHPLLMHARSSNKGPYDESGVRFMCHPSIGLKYPLDFEKDFDEQSVLERSYYEAAMRIGKVSSLQQITPYKVETYKNNRNRKRKR